MVRRMHWMAVGIAVLLLAIGARMAKAESPVIEGVVVDERRRPVADATVTARFGTTEVHATSDATGRFRVPLPEGTHPPTGCAIVARITMDDRPRVAVAHAHIPAAPHAWPEPLLRLADEDPFTIACTVDGAPAAGVRGVLCWDRWSTATPMLTASTDAEGHLHVRLPRGQYKFVVTDPRYAGTIHSVITPISAREDLRGFEQPPLAFKRPRDVRVRVVDLETGAPIEDAYVVAGQARERFQELVPGSPRLRTDAEGVATLTRIPRGMRVGIWAGRQDNTTAGRVEIDAEATEAEVRLTKRATHTIRWPRPRDARTPPVGAAVRFRADVHETTGVDLPLRMTDDAMVLDSYPDDSEFGYAVYEERLAAHLTYDLVHRHDANDLDPDGGSLEYVHKTTRFHGLVPFAARVVDADGQALEGALLYLEGRYLLPGADGRLTRGEHVTLTTDAEGYVRGQGIFFDPVLVKLQGLPEQLGGHPLGRLDPERDGGASTVFTLPRVRDVEVHVTIDGEPRLHAGLDVTTLTMLGTARYDAERAIVRFRILHDTSKGHLSFHPQLPGHHEHDTTVDIPDEGPIVVRTDLRTSCAIALQLDPQSAVGHKGGVIELHRLDPSRGWVYQDDGTWTEGSIHESVDLRFAGHPNWRAFKRLSAGTYRLVHTPSGLVQGPFTIDSSKPVWDVTLRLGSLPIVRGTVHGAKGLLPELAWILEPEGAPSLPWLDEDGGPLHYRTTADAEGVFQLTLDDRAEGRYVVDHPLCEPAPFTVPEGSTKPIAVTLTPRPHVAIPIKVPSVKHLSRANVDELLEFALGGWTSPLGSRLRSRRKGQLQAPVRVLRRVEQDGKVTWEPRLAVWRGRDQTLLVPLEPGTHRLFLDLAGTVPVAMHPIDVPKAGRTLPARVPFLVGARVGVTLAATKEDPLVRATLKATPILAEGDPPFVRSEVLGVAHYEDTVINEIVTEGLPPGRYTLVLDTTTSAGRKRSLTREIRVEGTQSLELGPDLKKPTKAKAR